MADRKTSTDERIGENLHRLRERAGFTQDEFARLMTERGRRWHQSTTARVEDGRQQVRASDLEAMAAILGTSVSRMLMPGPESSALALVDAAHGNVATSWHAATQACERLIRDLEYAARTLEPARSSQYDSVREAAEELALEVAGRTPESALDEAYARCAPQEDPAGEDEDNAGENAQGQR